MNRILFISISLYCISPHLIKYWLVDYILSRMVCMKLSHKFGLRSFLFPKLCYTSRRRNKLCEEKKKKKKKGEKARRIGTGHKEAATEQAMKIALSEAIDRYLHIKNTMAQKARKNVYFFLFCFSLVLFSSFLLLFKS